MSEASNSATEKLTLEQAIATGELKVDGKRGQFDDVAFWFNILTP